MTDSTINRRTALGVLGATGLAAISASTSRARAHTAASLGWNDAKMAYELPPLPYAFDALEPHIDAQTMEIHHDKHHAGYVKGLNAALDRLHAMRAETADAATIQHWQRQLSFHAGGHLNHTLFWSGMAPADEDGGGAPTGILAEAINRNFGSYDRFAWQFQRAAATVEGSGWAWLVYEPTASMLMISQMENQQKLLVPGSIPLLGVDVWEHAYYLKYQNRRATYLEAFMNVINWPEIQRRYDSARG